MVELLLRKRGVDDQRVLAAATQVERHRFVSAPYVTQAYGPQSVPIGSDQRMPHPQVVGMMAHALQLTGSERVLEIGTGSGYQTALLSQLADEVCSLESLPEMAAAARARLHELGFNGWTIRTDASLNWAGISDFDAIHVSVAVPEVPGRLLEQLAPGGRMVLPVGRSHYQRLMLLTRQPHGVVARDLGRCRLLPVQNVSPPGHIEAQPLRRAGARSRENAPLAGQRAGQRL
jgi:protein-L-isoaspartate(D-aspartate) O-methyltransferase